MFHAGTGSDAELKGFAPILRHNTADLSCSVLFPPCILPLEEPVLVRDLNALHFWHSYSFFQMELL